MKASIHSISHITTILITAAGLASALAVAQEQRATLPEGPLAGSSRNSVLAIHVQHPILLFSDKPDVATSTMLSVQPVGFPPDAQVTYQWRQVQDVLSPIAARMDEGKRISFTSPDAASTVATFPDWGVYEIRLTATDTKTRLSVSWNTWVNVWDCRSHILVDGKADPLAVAPGINPPTSVRNLSPDPGPFAHPRIYCTDLDWPEIHHRTTKGILAAKALGILWDGVSKGIDTPSSEFGKLTASLVAYADAGYAGPAPDLAMGIAAEVKDRRLDWGRAKTNLAKYYEHLRDACFVAWVGTDPAIPHDQVTAGERVRLRRLAKAVAAVSRLHLENSWDRRTGTFKKDYPLYIDGLDMIGEKLPHFGHLALAFDYIAPWMTPEEQREARNLLFATSVGRPTGARIFASQANGVVLDHGVERGLQQNGDFINIEEERILTALCIAGEDNCVDPQIVRTFTTLPKPKDYETSGKVFAYDWIRPADYDGGRNHPASKPYPIGSVWPFARKVEVDNLQRAIWWNDDAYVSPWGFQLNKEAYYGFSALGLWPSAVAYARHGAENQYVTGLYYQTAIHLLYNYYVGAVTRKSDHFRSNVYIYDHHDGGGDYRQTHVLLMKYMYPDDPLVDYIYAANADSFENRVFNPFNTALFGMDPGINGKTPALPEMAKQKALPLTKLDPQQGLVVVRSGWQDTDAMLYFDEGWLNIGHMHAEKSNFSFYALGRPWSIPPGYHIVESNYQSLVSIQDPAYVGDPETQGYVGESPSIIPKGSKYPPGFPTPPGQLLEVVDGPDQLYTVMAGDAKTAYDYCINDKLRSVEPARGRSQHAYPGVVDDMLSRWPDGRYVLVENRNPFCQWKEKFCPDYNPVQYTFRTILFVRGKHPYALIVDDIRKDDTPRNYRWSMNCTNAFGPPSGMFADAQGKPVASSLILAPGATATEATLLHLPDQGDTPGLPRLLLRDVSELDPHDQPAISIKPLLDRDMAKGAPPSNRVFIDRNRVVEPNYKVLLFPYRTGEKLPLTTWDRASDTLKIDSQDGAVDTVKFHRGDDNRTRIQFDRR